MVAGRWMAATRRVLIWPRSAKSRRHQANLVEGLHRGRSHCTAYLLHDTVGGEPGRNVESPRTKLDSPTVRGPSHQTADGEPSSAFGAAGARCGESHTPGCHGARRGNVIRREVPVSRLLGRSDRCRCGFDHNAAVAVQRSHRWRIRSPPVPLALLRRPVRSRSPAVVRPVRRRPAAARDEGSSG